MLLLLVLHWYIVGSHLVGNPAVEAVDTHMLEHDLSHDCLLLRTNKRYRKPRLLHADTAGQNVFFLKMR